MDLGALAGMLGKAAKGAAKGVGKVAKKANTNIKSMSDEQFASALKMTTDLAKGPEMDFGFYGHMDPNKIKRPTIKGGQDAVRKS